MDDHSPHHPDDEDDYDALAVLDFAAPDAGPESDLDALDGYDTLGDHASDQPDVDGDDLPVPLFTVTNPPGTVTVTTYMDGRVSRIDLTSQVARMTETTLADEILVVARLATQDARSAQYTFMLEGMRHQGHDDVTTRDFLSRDLDLPSPEQADAARAKTFATRYTGDHD